MGQYKEEIIIDVTDNRLDPPKQGKYKEDIITYATVGTNNANFAQ